MQITINYLVKTSFLLALIGFQSLEANDDSFEVNVPQLNEAPKIDGVLDEDVWKRAGSFSNFTQVRYKKALAVQAKKLKSRCSQLIKLCILVFYVLIMNLTKFLLKKDAETTLAEGDDRVRLAIDTFGRGINGYYFSVAGGGGKSDGVVRGGGRPDLTWVSGWDCDTSLDSKGWYVEFEIPFRSLAFDRNKSIWNFNVEER